MDRKLVNRWTPKLVTELLAAARRGASFCPFGRTAEGLIDWRGLPLSERLKVKGARFASADLSMSVIRNVWFENCVLEGLRLEDADMSQMADHGNRITNCLFRGAILRDSAIGYGGSRFEHCVWEEAQFGGAVFIRAEFDGCIFRSCDINGVDFNGSSFSACQFIGEIRDVWFRGGFGLRSDEEAFGAPRTNTMTGVSFEECTMRSVTFSDGCNLEGVTLPRAGGYRLVTEWPNRLQHLRRVSKSWGEAEKVEAEVYVRAHEAHAANQLMMVVGMDELVEEYGVDVGRRIMRALTELP